MWEAEADQQVQGLVVHVPVRHCLEVTPTVHHSCAGVGLCLSPEVVVMWLPVECHADKVSSGQSEPLAHNSCHRHS